MTVSENENPEIAPAHSPSATSDHQIADLDVDVDSDAAKQVTGGADNPLQPESTLPLPTLPAVAFEMNKHLANHLK
jgi:hypothetical protein